MVPCLLLGAFAAIGCSDNEGESESDRPAVERFDGALEQFLVDCKETYEADERLSDDVKGELEKLCTDGAEAIADGDKAATEVAREICLRVVEVRFSSRAARDALAGGCERGTQ